MRFKNSCMPIALSVLFPDKLIQLSHAPIGFSLGEMWRFGIENEVIKTHAEPSDLLRYVQAYWGKIEKNNAMVFFMYCTIKANQEQHFVALVQTRNDWALIDATTGKITSGRFAQGYFDLVDAIQNCQINTIAIWSEEGRLAQKEQTYFSHLFE